MADEKQLGKISNWSYVSLLLYFLSLRLPVNAEGDIRGILALRLGFYAAFQTQIIWQLTVTFLANVFYFASYIEFSFRWKLVLGALAFLCSLCALLVKLPGENNVIQPGIGMYCWQASMALIAVYYAIKTYGPERK